MRGEKIIYNLSLLHLIKIKIAHRCWHFIRCRLRFLCRYRSKRAFSDCFFSMAPRGSSGNRFNDFWGLQGAGTNELYGTLLECY